MGQTQGSTANAESCVGCIRCFGHGGLSRDEYVSCVISPSPPSSVFALVLGLSIYSMYLLNIACGVPELFLLELQPHSAYQPFIILAHALISFIFFFFFSSSLPLFSIRIGWHFLVFYYCQHTLLSLLTSFGLLVIIHHSSYNN